VLRPADLSQATADLANTCQRCVALAVVLPTSPECAPRSPQSRATRIPRLAFQGCERLTASRVVQPSELLGAKLLATPDRA
jgi:hypothetical protein